MHIILISYGSTLISIYNSKERGFCMAPIGNKKHWEALDTYLNTLNLLAKDRNF